jgi:hypothetical protein
MSLGVRTNHHRRELIDGFTLSAKEREQFDYLNWAGIDEGTDSASFFRFRGELYDLGTFIRDACPAGWDGGMATSAFGGVIVRVVEVDGERCIVVGQQFS